MKKSFITWRPGLLTLFNPLYTNALFKLVSYIEPGPEVDNSTEHGFFHAHKC